MWRDRTVAVVLPTYRERASIRKVIEEFESLGLVDDIVVVNNNAEPGTSEEVACTSAREVVETRQGYGAAIRRGLAEVDADLVCVFEPDATFVASDLWKLLAYSDDFDFVYGSRTIPDFIWDGANMGRFLRWGNWGVAKMMETAFNTSSLSDVGCTMRVVSGRAVRALLPHFTVYDGAFGPEMMLLSIIGGFRIVQIPVNYRSRSGRPGTTERFDQALLIGLQMMRLIGSYRLRRRQIARVLEGNGVAGAKRPASEPRPGGEARGIFRRGSSRSSR
jgi:glycosyltransferase involved in cell wall biosynthesis